MLLTRRPNNTLALGLLWPLDGRYFNILFIHSPIKRLSTTDVCADETFWIFVPQSEDVLLGFLFVPCCNICNMDTHGGPRIQNDVIVSHTVSTRVGFMDVPSSYRQLCSGREASNPCAMVMTPISALCSAGRPLPHPHSDRLSMA